MSSPPVTIVLPSEVRPNDVLCGRGYYNTPGNDAFVRVCSARQADYLAAGTSRKAKQVVADEVREQLRQAGIDRFLQPADKAIEDQLKVNEDDTDETMTKKNRCWTVMSDILIDEKVKQALRQKRKYIADDSNNAAKGPMPTRRHRRGAVPSESSSISCGTRLQGAGAMLPGPISSYAASAATCTSASFHSAASETTTPSPPAVSVAPECVPSNSSRGQYEEDDPITANIRGFTTEEEVAEFQNLTIEDIVEIESDLQALPRPPASPPHNEDTASVLLARLDEELDKLPATKTAVYRHAVNVCPELVGNERKLLFLERENDDPALAAIRLARYWELKMEAFGPERCFLPLTLSGAMQDVVENMVASRTVSLLPETDTAGRAIVFVESYNRNRALLSLQQEAMIFFYLIEVVLEDPIKRKNGIVALVKYSVQSPPVAPREIRGFHEFLQSVPVRFRAFHACNAPWFIHNVFFPIAKYVLGKDFRQRLVSHAGTEEEVLASLDKFLITRDRVPRELGGNLVVDMRSFLQERRALEMQRLEAGIGRAPKKPKQESENENGDSFLHAIIEELNLGEVDSGR